MRAQRAGVAVRLTGLMAVLAVVAAGAQEGPRADALSRLRTGNAQFVADPSEGLPITVARRAGLVQGQTPFATILSCADSRVPPEAIFHAGLGDLFVVRAAGHVPDRAVLASLEYGAEHLRVPLLLVMGHEMCGAVKAAIDTPVTSSHGPNMDFLLAAIRPAVARAQDGPADVRLRAAILANVEETINSLLGQSALLRRMAEAGQITIAGAYYQLSTGRVHFSEPVQVPPVRTSSGVPSGAAPAAASRTPAAH
jgi:carbonic anhydrase